MADKLAWLFLILVGGGLAVGVIGLLMPFLIAAAGFGLTLLAFSLLAWLIGRILA